MIKAIADNRIAVGRNLRAAFGAVVLVGAGASYIRYDRMPPLELSAGTIEPNKVSPGSNISILWDVDQLKRGPCSLTATHEIADYQTKIPQRVKQEEIGDRLTPTDGLRTQAPVPFYMSWGPALYYYTSCYSCGTITTTGISPVCVRRGPLPFEIVPPPK